LWDAFANGDSKASVKINANVVDIIAEKTSMTYAAWLERLLWVVGN
jgi:hypothetical protein